VKLDLVASLSSYETEPGDPWGQGIMSWSTF
jgi:hypothetical protein